MSLREVVDSLTNTASRAGQEVKQTAEATARGAKQVRQQVKQDYSGQATAAPQFGRGRRPTVAIYRYAPFGGLGIDHQGNFAPRIGLQPSPNSNTLLNQIASGQTNWTQTMFSKNAKRADGGSLFRW